MPSAVAATVTFLKTVGLAVGGLTISAGQALAIGAATVVAGAVAAQKLIAELYKVPNIDSDRSRQATVRGTVEPQKLIYGEALVSGPISFVGVAGTDNRDLYHTIVLAGHPSDSISDIYFDDERIQSAHINASGNVTTGTFGPKDGTTICVIRKLTGDQTTADDVLDDAFSTIEETQHIGTNLTYIVTKFTLTDKSQETWDKFMPNDIKALVKGKKVYDPRQDSTSTYYDDTVGVSTQRSSDTTTWAWSENPVWCLVDYLTDDRFGMGIGLDRIDLSKAVDAADICDATVSVPGGSEKRFTCNGVIFGTTTHKTNINKLLSSMNGMLTYTNGKYVIRAGAFEAVGAGMTLTEDHMIGPVKLKTSFERNERFNTITGTFIDPSKNYKEIEFPKVQIASALTRDNNEELTQELKLSMTNSRYMAQRIAHKLIQLSDLQKVLTFPTNLAGVNISVGDRVNVTLSEFGYTNKTFVCLGWTLSESGSGGVNLTLREDDSSSYADLAQSGYSTVTPAGGIQQGFFGVPDPSGLSATAHIESIELDWTNPANMTGIIAIEVFASPNSSWSSAVKIGETLGTQFIHDESNGVDPIVENNQRYYWVRARRFPSGEGSDAVSDRNPDSDTSTVQQTKGALGNLADLDTVGEAQIDDNAVGSDQINDDEVLHEVPSEGLAHYWPCNSVADVDGDGDEELQEVVAGKTGIHYGTTAPTVTTDSPTGKATSLGDENGFILLNDADADALEHTFTAGSFVSGTSYVIKALGDTDFTAIGASANTVGTTFTATGAGTGTGAARVSNNAGFAWSMWFKSTSSSGNSEARLINRDPSDSWAILINQSSGSQNVNFYGEPGTESVATISTDEWHHIAFSEDGNGTISIYFDGEFVSTEAYTPVNSDVPVGIGSDIENGTIRFASYEFVGLISEIRAYNRALTAQEVRGLYKVPAAGSPAEVDGDMIIDGSLVAAKITVANLAEINDDVGTITGGDLGGVTIDSDKLYQGTGDWANSNTGFYLDEDGKFSLKDKLFFNPTNSRLTVDGSITADTITVSDQLEVFGPLRASALADGTITRDHFSQDAIDFIFGSIAPSVGGTNGDYKEASGNFTGSGGTVTVGSTSDKFDHGTLSVDVEFLVDHFFYSTTNYTTAQAQATLNFEVSADGTFTDLTSATKTHTLQFSEYDLSSYYGYTYLVYFLTGDVTKTFTTGTGNDLVDNTDYIFRVRVDGVGSAFSGQTVPFTVEANEGVTGVESTTGNATTLGGEPASSYLRSDEDDTFDANLTITGNLTVQGTQTTLNTATLQVEDKNITLNYGTGDTSGSANGAGITIQDAVDSTTDATILWDATNDEFDFSHPINVSGNSRVVGDSNSTGRAFRVQDSDNADLIYANNAGEVVIPKSYLYVSASQGIYSTGSIKARGGITNDGGNTLSISSGSTSITFNSKNFTSVGTISSGAVTSSTGTSSFYELTLTGDTDNLTFTEASGDWSILNAQQSNGLVIYDGTSGVTVLYNNAEVGQFDNSGFDVVSGAFKVGGTTRISSTGAGTFTDVTLSDASPQLTLSDTNSGGGGGAFGRIIFTNTAGNAIGIGYTGDSSGDSDLIISTNAAGTYGGYMSLDAAAIVDTQADIILEPKTNVRIATGGLKIGTTTFVDSSRNITAGTISSGNITSSGNVQAGTTTGYLYAKSLRLENGEVADSDFQHAYQMIVDANDTLSIMSNKGDFDGGYPFGIFFLGDNAGTTKTLGSGLVGVWNTTNFKKAHVDHMVGLYDGTQDLTVAGTLTLLAASGSSDSIIFDYNGDDLDVTTGTGTYTGAIRANLYKVGTSTVIDENSNLTNIESADIDGFVLENSAHRGGLLNIPQRDSTNSYTGIMIERDNGDHWAVMASDTLFGIYDDINSDWALQATEGAEVKLYYAGSSKLNTLTDGVNINGKIAVSSTTVIDASRNVTLNKLGTATDSATQFNSPDLRLYASGWDTNNNVARTVGWKIRNVPTASVYPDHDLQFIESDQGSEYIKFQLHGRGSTNHTDPLAATFFGNVSIEAGTGGTNAGDGDLTVADAISGGRFKLGSTTIIDGSANLTSIGTISAGNTTITNSGSAASVTVTRSDTSTSAVFLVGSSFSYIGTTDNKPFHIYQNGASALEFNTSKDAAFAGDISCDAITASGAHTFTANDVDFIVQDTTDSVTNYIWRDHSNDKLYLGTGNAVVDLRSVLKINNTERIDMSGNATLGTISSGAISAAEQSVFTGNAISGTPNSNAQIVAADSGVAGIAIHSNDGGQGYLWFGDNTNNAVGRIYYNHSTDKVHWRVGGTDDAHTLDSSGNATFAGDITAQDLTLLSSSGHTRFTLGSRSGDPTPSSDGSYDFRPGMRVAAFEPSDGSVDGDADLPLAWTGSLYLAGSQTYATASSDQVFTFSVNFSGGTRWFAKVKTNDAESGNFPYLAVNAGTEYALEYFDAPPSNGENDTDAWHVIDITDDVVTGSNTLKVWLGGGQKTYVLAIYVYPSTGIMLPNEPYESVGYFHKGIGVGDSRILDEDANLSNIGTLSSGAITTSGSITTSGTLDFTANPAYIRNDQDASGQIVISAKNSSSQAQQVRWDAANNTAGAWRPETTNVSDLGLTNRIWNTLYINLIKHGASNDTFLDQNLNVTANNVYLGSTNNTDYLTGNSRLSIDGYMMVKGIINTEETGTGATGITFGNGSTLGTDQISLITSGARQFYISSTGVAQFSEDVLVLGDNLDIQQSLRHNGNTDTRIEFTTNRMDFKTSATARLIIDTANVTIKDDLIVEDTSPVITISDTTNGGGGGAEGKIIFKNTEGNAIGIGYTGDVITDSDLIISTDAGGTYGTYLGLDAAGISDTQSDIILEPKTSVRIANGGLKVGTEQVISSTRRFYASEGTSVKAAYSFDGDSGTGISRTASGRIDFLSSGAIKAYIRTGTTNPISDTMYVDGQLGVNGKVVWSGGSSTNANTAYGWGDHASAGYLSTADYDTHVCHLKTNVSAAVDQGVGNEFTVNFNLEEHNDSTTFSHSSGVVTVATAGWYRIYANMVYQNGSSSARNTVRAYVEKNGTEITSTATYDYDRGSSYGEFSNNKIETMLYLAANDTIGIGNYAENEDGSITIEAAECEFIVSSVSVQTTTTNADTVDGLHASSFIRSDAADTVSGEITFSSNIYVADRIIHNNDTNTYLEFLGDRVRILSGNVEMIDCVESTTDYVDIVDRVRVTAGGDLECEGNITAYTSTSISDINQKENIQRIESPIEKIKAISGYTFDWKQSGEHSGGVIAQEIEHVMPDIVKEKSIRDGEKMKAVDYQAIIGLLVETVKDLNQRIEDLENGDD